MSSRLSEGKRRAVILILRVAGRHHTIDKKSADAMTVQSAPHPYVAKKEGAPSFFVFPRNKSLLAALIPAAFSQDHDGDQTFLISPGQASLPFSLYCCLERSLHALFFSKASSALINLFYQI